MNDELRTRLTELGLNEDQVGKLAEQGVVSDAEMVLLSEHEIREITGCTVIAAKKAAAAFSPKPSEAEVEASNTAAIRNVLPALPDDQSFLEMLKVGGVLKVDRTNVIAAMRAAIASDIGLYALPDRLIQRMEAFALEQDEPVGESFYRLQKQLAERRYGEVLAALGTTGNFVSDKRKRETLERLDALLWPALRGFNTQLRAWVEAWSQGAANPAALMMAMAVSQGPRGVMPPGMLQPPDTAVLRDEGEGVVNSINKVFAGTGIPVARALAYDALRIREVLEDPSLPSTVGAATRDQMIKMLGIDVGADYVRLEQNVSRFALAIMELPKVAAGNEEVTYLSALYTLGVSVPWDKLGRSLNLSPKASRAPRPNPAFIRGDQPDWDRDNT